ncbi:MAG: SPOR domain-containing protein [Treponema sp.]|jgi:cell division protein FtsN|nr:SPOR domain-containing protein [Treponema sp.]
MKKRVIGIVTAALVALTNASIWEGSAAVAPNGDLPDKGYYAGTNSFPRNTVVDITNLENGKSIRVIVASGLETPGLLAVLSKDAAEIIDLPHRSIGRIRMSQPSDPIAFSRFTEGAPGGDPDYDPKALVESEKVYANPLAESPPRFSQAYPGSSPAPAYVSEPEWENDSYHEIVDLPENPAEATETAEAVETAESTEAAEAPAPPEAPPPAEEAGEGADAETAPVLAEDSTAAPDEAKGIEDSPPEYFVPPENAESIARVEGMAEPEAGGFGEEAAGKEPETVPEEKPVTETPPVPDPEKEYDYVLVPAEERPPEYSPETLPEDAGLVPPETVAAGSPPEEEPPVSLDTPAIPDTPAYEDTIHAEAPETLPPVSPEPWSFSVPVIGGLEHGKYYVQLGAFSKAEAVESEISRIGGSYPIAVQNGGSGDRPLYRILLGPMNLGESGALLQRFKSIGYSDAFVRVGGS